MHLRNLATRLSKSLSSRISSYVVSVNMAFIKSNEKVRLLIAFTELAISSEGNTTDF